MDGTIKTKEIFATILKAKSIGNVTYGTPPVDGGLYYWEDMNKYIFRGGIIIESPFGPDNYQINQYLEDTYLKVNGAFVDIDNYVKVPWENNEEVCRKGTPENDPYEASANSPCWRIISVNSDDSITIVRDRNAIEAVPFDDVYNPEGSSFFNDGFNDLLENPNRPGPDKYSKMYHTLYGINGYENTILSNHKYLLKPIDVCLNKVGDYASVNELWYDKYLDYDNLKGYAEQYVLDTCVITNKTSVLPVAPLQNKYVRLPYTEEFLNASLDSYCKDDKGMRCRFKNFMYNKSNYWSINGYPYNSFLVRAMLIIGRAEWGATARYLYGVRPVVTLKSTVKITGGDGSVNNPYIIME